MTSAEREARDRAWEAWCETPRGPVTARMWSAGVEYARAEIVEWLRTREADDAALAVTLIVAEIERLQRLSERMRELTESVRARNERIHAGVTEAQVEAGARALCAFKNEQDRIHSAQEGQRAVALSYEDWRDEWNAEARAVLSAAREVKSDGD